MKKASFLIPPENIILQSQADSKRGVIEELIQNLSSIDPDTAMEVVMKRERLGSTGIGHGVAIPHGRVPGLSSPVIALARHKEGLDFDAIDGRPVHIVVLLLAPDDASRSHLELLAHLARILQSRATRQAIMQAKTREEISKLFPQPTKEAA